jgi:carbonic anhydrase/acetyltransferase-like protein (isoleucine patch superfamily)
MIQDNSRLGSNTGKNGKINIGDNVYVGANSRIEECELESFSYVGMGASIGKGCTIESFSVVAAGAHVPEGTTVPTG